MERSRARLAFEILGVILHQHKRQLPSLSAVIIVILLFWFFLGHMIFALFLELATMTNISSSLEVYLSINGFMMLAIGSTVGALFALLVYMITLFSVPMLVAREVDFVTAMIVSFQAVQNKFFNLMIWTLNHCGIYIFVHVAVVFRAVSDSAFIWACGMASL